MEEINPEPVDETNPKLVYDTQQITVDSSCADCGMSCHAIGRVVNGNPSEKIRFMYEDSEVPTQADTVIDRISNQSIIPTSFEGEYFKLEPGQLP
jgi:hypothetical protein